MRGLLQRLSSGSTLLTVAIALGGATAVATLLFLEDSGGDSASRPTPATSEVEQLPEAGDPIVVARDEIPAGTELSAALMRVIEVPKGTRPASAFEAIEELEGRVARYPITIGEQILPSRLVPTDPDQRAGLAYSVPPGMRAVSVSFSDALGGGGLVVPGDRVDVLISTTHGALFGPGEVITPEDEQIAASPTVFTLLQNVLVLAIGQAFTQPPEAVEEEAELRLEEPVLVSAGTITLAVPPEDAQLLFFAAGRGTLALALRRFGDDSEVVLDFVDKLERAGISSVTGAEVTR